MTENENSPENLRKFLENDDPAMRRMGLSMAKGSGVPDNLQKNIFGLALWDPEKENLESAREIVEHIGLDNIKELPPWWHPFTNLHGHGAQKTLIQCSAVWNMGLMKKKQIELMLIEILKEHDNIGRYDYRKIAIAILGNIKSKKSVDTLIEILNKIKKYADVQSWVNDEIKEIIRSLGLINNRKSRNALIDLIKYEPKNPIYSNGDGKHYSPGIDEDIKEYAEYALKECGQIPTVPHTTNLTEISPGVLRREHHIFWSNWLLAENIFEYNWINYPAMRELRWVSLIDRKKKN